MQWNEIRREHPHQWLLIEAIEAHSEAGERILDDLALVGRYSDSRAAMIAYQDLHRERPDRELYVVHTDREKLAITDLHWFGYRAAS